MILVSEYRVDDVYIYRGENAASTADFHQEPSIDEHRLGVTMENADPHMHRDGEYIRRSAVARDRKREREARIGFVCIPNILNGSFRRLYCALGLYAHIHCSCE